MEDIKRVIADNIALLRKGSGMTQIELAEKLNYSDKAISKWERGESVPDISVLKQIADMYGVTVDYLITPGHSAPPDTKEIEEREEKERKARRVHGVVTGMSVLLVWLIALTVFLAIDIPTDGVVAHWLAFAYACPVSAIVWLVFNAIWFSHRRNYLIISLLMWTLIFALHLTMIIACSVNLWQLYILCLPGQMIILLWSLMGKQPSGE